VLLLAQAGVPFTTGFIAKLEVVEAAVNGGSADLAVVAMVSAAIAAFFYLRVALLMYAPAPDVAEGDEEPGLLGVGGPDLGLAGAAAGPGAGERLAGAPSPTLVGAGEAGAVAVVTRPPVEGEAEIPAGVAFGVALCVLVTVVFGIWPQPLTSFAQHATLLLRP
jgi:NADH:ubiquinone oxidoreductase subunit 2 (subunit N)